MRDYLKNAPTRATHPSDQVCMATISSLSREISRLERENAELNTLTNSQRLDIKRWRDRFSVMARCTEDVVLADDDLGDLDASQHMADDDDWVAGWVRTIDAAAQWDTSNDDFANHAPLLTQIELAWQAKVNELRNENAELRNKIATYEGQTRWLCQCGGVNEELASLRADKERLDSGIIRLSGYDAYWGWGLCLHKGVDLRAAIDAAMKEGAK